jgi:hypothetical protein
MADPAPPAARFQETNLWATPIRDLGLTIEGTRLEPIRASSRRSSGSRD